MSTYKSDFLNILSERGFIHQVSEPDVLDARAVDGTLTAYIGFDCTAASLHIGSLLPIMMLYWLQQTGHRPIALMGGGTTRVGDPSRQGREPAYSHRRDDQRKPRRHPRDLFQVPEIRGPGRQWRQRHHGQQCRLAEHAQLHRFPARRRQAFLGQPHARLQFGEAAARAPAGAVVPRIQLHGAAGLRLR